MPVFLNAEGGQSFVRGCLINLAKAGEQAKCVPKNSKIMEVPQMAANGKRVKITLSCTECKQRNYNTIKNKQNTPDRLEMNKYCRFCRKHTLHKETK